MKVSRKSKEEVGNRRNRKVFDWIIRSPLRWVVQMKVWGSYEHWAKGEGETDSTGNVEVHDYLIHLWANNQISNWSSLSFCWISEAVQEILDQEPLVLRILRNFLNIKCGKLVWNKHSEEITCLCANNAGFCWFSLRRSLVLLVVNMLLMQICWCNWKDPFRRSWHCQHC